jgi:hypothetical protein
LLAKHGSHTYHGEDAREEQERNTDSQLYPVRHQRVDERGPVKHEAVQNVHEGEQDREESLAGVAETVFSGEILTLVMVTV